MLPFFADMSGLFGSIALAVPAFKYSNLHKLVKDIQKISSSLEGNANDPGPELVGVLKDHLSSWNKYDHIMLMLGIALLVIAFLLKIISHFL